MSLSPESPAFFSCSFSFNLSKRDRFLKHAQESLSKFHFSLFHSILMEWESSPLLSSCFSLWKNYNLTNFSQHSSLQVLSFNVRGFELRWQEVLLLTYSFDFDIIILSETGSFDWSTCTQAFPDRQIFYQKGENRNGGVLVLVKSNLSVKRIECKLPNVCVIDLLTHEQIRVIGIYASDSRSWSWDDLSPLITSKCVIYGDFNVDLEKDISKANQLLTWADKVFLAPYAPKSKTSLRSDRILDYALTGGIVIDIQTLPNNTTSDHYPIVSSIPTNYELRLGRTVHRKVFELFTEFTYEFWEKSWKIDTLDLIYHEYITFLKLLWDRCTTTYHPHHYRMPIPAEFRAFISYVRALSFRQMRCKCPQTKQKVNQLRKIVKNELKELRLAQLSDRTQPHQDPTKRASTFWPMAKKALRAESPVIQAFISTNGDIIREPQAMCLKAADFYENALKSSEIRIRTPTSLVTMTRI